MPAKLACLFQINTLLVRFNDFYLYSKIQRQISIHSGDLKIKEHPNLIGQEHFLARLFKILASLFLSWLPIYIQKIKSRNLKIKEYSNFIGQEQFRGMARHIWVKLVGSVCSFAWCLSTSEKLKLNNNPFKTHWQWQDTQIWVAETSFGLNLRTRIESELLNQLSAFMN